MHPQACLLRLVTLSPPRTPGSVPARSPASTPASAARRRASQPGSSSGSPPAPPEDRQTVLGLRDSCGFSGAHAMKQKGLHNPDVSATREQMFTFCSHFRLREYFSLTLTSQKALLLTAALPNCNRYSPTENYIPFASFQCSCGVVQPPPPCHCRAIASPHEETWALPPSSLQPPSAPVPGHHQSASWLSRLALSDHLRMGSYSLWSCVTWEAVTSVHPTAPSPGQVITVSQVLQLCPVLHQ